LNHTLNGKPITSVAGSLSISGTGDFPKQSGLNNIAGSAKVSFRVLQKPAGAQYPPFTIGFVINGHGGHGTSNPTTLNVAGGFTFTGKDLFIKWRGKNYDVGESLTSQLLHSVQKAAPGATTPLNVSKLLTAMALQPGTWLKTVTVTDGGTIDQTPTWKVAGPVDFKTTIADVVDGLKALPAAAPQLLPSGGKAQASIAKLKTPSDAAITKGLKGLDTADVAAWVGKSDKLLRQFSFHIVAHDTSSSAGKLNAQVAITEGAFNQNTPIATPANAAPITDLLAVLEKEFPQLGKVVGG